MAMESWRTGNVTGFPSSPLPSSLSFSLKQRFSGSSGDARCPDGPQDAFTENDLAQNVAQGPTSSVQCVLNKQTATLLTIVETTSASSVARPRVARSCDDILVADLVRLWHRC